MNAQSIQIMEDLIQATCAAAIRVRNVDGIPLEWDDGLSARSMSPLLKLPPVGAQFKGEMFPATRNTQKGHRIVFGWVTCKGEGKKDVPDIVWNLEPSCNGETVAWDVNQNEIVGASSGELAVQIVRLLINFSHRYSNAAG